jgi:hypothetical protein
MPWGWGKKAMGGHRSLYPFAKDMWNFDFVQCNISNAKGEQAQQLLVQATTGCTAITVAAPAKRASKIANATRNLVMTVSVGRQQGGSMTKFRRLIAQLDRALRPDYLLGPSFTSRHGQASAKA